MSRRKNSESVFVYIAAVCIPLLLIILTIQSNNYAKLKGEVKALEEKQVELVEQNKKYISDISLLSSSDRIEHLAEQELGMHKAKTEEIVRVEMKGEKNE